MGAINWENECIIMDYIFVMTLLILCFTGYLIGSIPTGFLLIKHFKGIDLRDFGSNSTGATNVLRVGDKKLAFFTLLCDALKGIIFTFFIRYFFSESINLIAVFCCIFGHTYPVWLKFRGGKGVATSAGIFLVLSPLYGFISIIIWAIVAKLLKISSVASLILSISFVILCFYGVLFSNTNLDVFIFALSCFIFLIFTHLNNIKRLFNKDESHTTIR